MNPPTGALSQTLQSLTLSKISEVEKLRAYYESQKANVLQNADQNTDQKERISQILAGIQEFYPSAYEEVKVSNIRRWLNQARYDSSIPPETLQYFEAQLRARLDVQSRRLGLADLYCRLLVEWMEPPAVSPGACDGITTDEDYLLVENKQKQKLRELCDRFETVVFEPLETDEGKIWAFLNDLFPDEQSEAALEALREQIEASCVSLWEEEEPFNPSALTKCIRGLLTEDLLSEEKQEILKHFLGNSVALAEISDVLNMRFADLDNWNWNAGQTGIPVLPRQQVNGKFRIWMDEDVLQAIFTQYIFTRLCNSLKAILKSFITDDAVWNWKSTNQMTERDRLRWRYYFNQSPPSGGIKDERKRDFLDTHFLFQLPLEQDSLYERGAAYDDDGEEQPYGSKPEGKNVKQQLLRKIATETLIQRELNGEAVVVQSDLQWYATALPHSTIFAVVKYLGIPETWVLFFKKYLQTPLNMIRSFENTEGGPRIRHRGVPMSHASEKFLGELVLFFMDLAVNRETGMLLYRLHDDLWFCGEPKQCADAWDVLQRYAKVTGLEFNGSKTGSVYMSNAVDGSIACQLPKGPVKFGFLSLNPAGTWVIDHSQVDAHLQQLQKQLNHCDSLISWIRTWNSCIGRFFKSTFGEPAFCFGRPHVDAILATYEKLQNTLFPDKGDGSATRVTDYLRQKIKSRFGEFDIPDAFFFLPENLGGLALRNPFAPILLVRDSIEKSPIDIIETFRRDEIAEYNNAKKEFEELSERTRWRRYDMVNKEADLTLGSIIKSPEMNKFMPFDEYTKFRDSRSVRLRTYYWKLLAVPQRSRILYTDEAEKALFRVKKDLNFRDIDREKEWILSLYAEELLEKFGSFNLVDPKFLPVGVLSMVKGKRVKWQMVL